MTGRKDGPGLVYIAKSRKLARRLRARGRLDGLPRDVSVVKIGYIGPNHADLHKRARERVRELCYEQYASADDWIMAEAFACTHPDALERRCHRFVEWLGDRDERMQPIPPRVDPEVLRSLKKSGQPASKEIFAVELPRVRGFLRKFARMGPGRARRDIGLQMEAEGRPRRPNGRRTSGRPALPGSARGAVSAEVAAEGGRGAGAVDDEPQELPADELAALADDDEPQELSLDEAAMLAAEDDDEPEELSSEELAAFAEPEPAAAPPRPAPAGPPDPLLIQRRERLAVAEEHARALAAARALAFDAWVKPLRPGEPPRLPAPADPDYAHRPHIAEAIAAALDGEDWRDGDLFAAAEEARRRWQTLARGDIERTRLEAGFGLLRHAARQRGLRGLPLPKGRRASPVVTARTALAQAARAVWRDWRRAAVRLEWALDETEREQNALRRLLARVRDEPEAFGQIRRPAPRRARDDVAARLRDLAAAREAEPI